MGDHRSRLYDPGPALAGGAPLHGARGLPCRYHDCRALFAAPGMARSLDVLRDVAAARDAHERELHGAVFPTADLPGTPARIARDRAVHAAGGRARWARKGRAL